MAKANKRRKPTNRVIRIRESELAGLLDECSNRAYRDGYRTGGDHAAVRLNVNVEERKQTELRAKAQLIDAMAHAVTAIARVAEGIK